MPCGSPPLSLLIVALAAINTPPEMHWLNGVAENTIRVLTRTTRINLCQLVGAVICGVTIKDPQPFWPLAMENAKQVYNYMPNVTLPAFRRPYSLPSLDVRMEHHIIVGPPQGEITKEPRSRDTASAGTKARGPALYRRKKFVIACFVTSSSSIDRAALEAAAPGAASRSASVGGGAPNTAA